MYRDDTALEPDLHIRATKLRSNPSPPNVPHISIIIPTLNEVQQIQGQLDGLADLSCAEVIFADGGSTDGTLQELERATAQRGAVRCVHSSRSRSMQMNAGASTARGEWLIFLHADTMLPPESYRKFQALTTTRADIQSGSFTFRVNHTRWIYRYLEFYVGFRCSLFKLPYGDQAIFVRRSLFQQLGGYRTDYPLMEDLELVQRLNKLPGFAILDAPVFTSARRFEADGYLKRTLGNLYLQFLYSTGTHPRELARRYYAT